MNSRAVSVGVTSNATLANLIRGKGLRYFVLGLAGTVLGTERTQDLTLREAQVIEFSEFAIRRWMVRDHTRSLSQYVGR